MKKLETKSMVLLKHHLKGLKLPTMHAECEKIAQRCAADNADHLAFLLQLCELELIERERKAAERRLKMARFPACKLLLQHRQLRIPVGNRLLQFCISLLTCMYSITATRPLVPRPLQLSQPVPS